MRPDVKWYRASNYEYFNGVIVPAADATVEEYDPWEGFEAGTGGYQPTGEYTRARYRGIPLYLQIINLVDDLDRLREEWDGAADTASKRKAERHRRKYEKTLLDWCRDHGLLGIYPHELISAENPPMKNKRGVWYQWRCWASGSKIQESFSKAAGVAEARVMLERPDEVWVPSHIEVDAANINSRFFPRRAGKSASRLPMQLPWQPEFRLAYGEPAHEFLRYAGMLRSVYQFFNDHSGYFTDKRLGRLYRGKKKSNTDHLWEVATIQGNLLDYLLSRVTSSFNYNPDGSYRMTWRARSLIAVAAQMALIDLTDAKGDLARCEICNHLFWTSDAERTTYCSPRCKRTSNQRQYRAAKK